MHGGDRRAATRLEVDRLPDPTRGSVALFAFELERMRCVVHTQHQVMRAAHQAPRELERKRSVTALMLAELLAVEPSGRAPVARAHDEEDTLAAPRRRHGNLARVPADVRA